MDDSVLREIGLSPGESTVYLALLRLGSSRVSSLAKESGLHRTNIYDTLEKLKEKGLVSSVTKENRMYFQAAPPEQLNRYYEGKQERLQKLIPELEKSASFGAEETDVEVFKGVEGIRTVLRDIIKTGKDYVCYGEEGHLDEIVPVALKQHSRDLVRNNIQERLLVKESRKGKVTITSKNTKLKHLPDDYFTPSTTYVYGNNTAIFAFTKPYYVIVIRNPAIANSYRNTFEMLWKQNIQVMEGTEGPRKILKDMISTGKPIIGMGIEDSKYWEHVPETIAWFFKQVDAKKMDDRMLVKHGEKVQKGKESKVRYYPADVFSPVSTEVYGKKVGIISWTPPINTILIENNQVADSFRKHFDMLWNQRVMSYQGADQVEQLFNEIKKRSKKSKEYLVFGVPPTSEMFFEYFESFGEYMTRHGVNSRVIADETGKVAIDQMVRLGFDVRVQPREFFTPVEVDIAGSLVGMIAWSKKPYAFSIDDKEMARSFRSFFEMQWRLARKTTG